MAPYASNSKPFARVSLALIGLAWTLPFLQPYHVFPLSSFYSEWLALTLGLVALVPLLRRDAWNALPVPVVALAALALILLLWLQFALGLMPYLGQALTPSLYLLWAASLAVVGNLLRRELGLERVVTTLAWFLLAGGVLSAAAGVLQHYHVTPLAGSIVVTRRMPQVIGNIAQANHYAAYTALALIAVTYLASRKRLTPALAVPITVALAFVAALSGSRSAWLYVTAMLLLALALVNREPAPEHRRLAIICAALLPLLALMNAAALLPWLAPPEMKMITSLDRLFDVASGLDARVALWREAWWMFSNAPLLGVGFGQYAWHHFEYQALTGLMPEMGIPNNAHSLPMHLLAEAGLPGAALVLGAFAYWLAGLRGFNLNEELWWLLAVLAVIALHSLLEFPMWYTYFLGIAAVAFGIGTTRAVTVQRARIGPPLAALLLAAGFVLSAMTLRDFRRVEQLVFKPYRAQAEIPGAGVFRDVLSAAHRDPLLTPYVEIAIAFGIPVTEDELSEKVALLGRATRFAPLSVLLHRQAMLLALAGEREAAHRLLEQSLRVYPQTAAAAIPQLEELARRHPARFEPLLELATSVARATPKNP